MRQQTQVTRNRTTRVTVAEQTPEERLKWLRFRIALVVTVVMLCFLVVLGQAFRLQIMARDKLLYEAERNYMRTKVIASQRGAIFDRNGEQLATSVGVDTVVMVAQHMKDPQGTASRLAAALNGVDADTLVKRMRKSSWWAYAKRRITEEEAQRVRDLDLPGVEIVQEPKRFYPKKELAGQLLGRVGMDNDGLEGLEQALDDILVRRKPAEPAGDVEGTAKATAKPRKPSLDVVKVPYLKDIYGQEAYVLGLPQKLLTEGYSVVLTLDEKIQAVAEEALAKAVKAHNAMSGIAIVMDVRTGELLAVANVPTFDPNKPDPTDMFSWKNRALKDVYEPGSTFKVISLAAVLERNAARLDEIVDCERGAMRVGRYTIRDTHRADKLTVREVLSHSSNIGITKLTRRIGKGSLLESIEKFGFGQVTGLDAGWEAAGKVQPLERWADITFANVSFGQGIAVTPMQMVRAFAAIGNGGVLMRPQIVKKLLDSDGNEVRTFVPESAGRALSPRAAKLTLDAMAAVTREGGTGTNAAIEGYSVGGKTGTAQKPDTGYRKGVFVGRSSKGYRDDAWISSFIGVVPVEAPRLAILVVVDEPDGRGFGGVVAAPVFKEVAEFSLKYLEIPPSVRRPIKVSRIAKAAAAAADDRARVDLTESLGDAPADPESAVVPDFLGVSIGRALDLAVAARVQVEVDGTGKAVEQSLPPGSAVAPGTTVTLRFGSAFDQGTPRGTVAEVR